MTIFDFDKVSADRISNIIKSSIMSLKDCIEYKIELNFDEDVL